MLHGIGKIILSLNFPERYKKISDSKKISEAEEKEFGVNHSHIGAYLLGIWGLPNPVIEAIAYHHKPSLSPIKEFSTIACVHIASAIENSFRAEVDINEFIDSKYLSQIGKSDQLETWQEICAKILKGEKQEA